MLELASVLTNQLSIQTGKVAGFKSEGLILVMTVMSNEPVLAQFLRTSNAAPPKLEIGDEVLLAADLDDARGYVLGAIVPHFSLADKETSQEVIELENASRGDIEISLARNAPDAMRLRGKRIFIEAGEEIQLKCGGGTIQIDKAGKIVVRGTDVVSRARRSNKIKGAAVAIN